MTIVAIFEWDDGYVSTIKYPKSVKSVTHNGTRPSNLKVLIKDAKAYESKVAEWFSDCYAALAKI